MKWRTSFWPSERERVRLKVNASHFVFHNFLGSWGNAARIAIVWIPFHNQLIYWLFTETKVNHSSEINLQNFLVFYSFPHTNTDAYWEIRIENNFILLNQFEYFRKLKKKKQRTNCQLNTASTFATSSSSAANKVFTIDIKHQWNGRKKHFDYIICNA